MLNDRRPWAQTGAPRCQHALPSLLRRRGRVLAASAGHLAARREDDLGSRLLAEPDLRPQGLNLRVGEALDGLATLVLDYHRVEALVRLLQLLLLIGGWAPRPPPGFLL